VLQEEGARLGNLEKIAHLKSAYYDEPTRKYFELNHKFMLDEETIQYHNNKDSVESEQQYYFDINGYFEFVITSIDDRRKNFYILNLTSINCYDRSRDRYMLGNAGEKLSCIPANQRAMIYGKNMYCSMLDPTKKFNHNLMKIEVRVEMIKGKVKKSVLEGMKNDRKLYLRASTEKVSIFNNLMKGNLVLFCNGRISNMRLKDIITGAAPPEPITTQSFEEYKHFIHANYKNEFEQLNCHQQEAIVNSILTNDLWCVLGYPGSGKTTYIVLLIRMLIKLGKTVLVVSHTHTVLDQILLRLLKYDEVNELLRISNNIEDVHPDIRKFVMNWKMYQVPGEFSENTIFKGISECKAYLEGVKLCASTLGGLGQSVINRNKFDYCIVDEAGQALEPAILGGVLLAQKMILIGDPNQVNYRVNI
jgi:hypothetical protein